MDRRTFLKRAGQSVAALAAVTLAPKLAMAGGQEVFVGEICLFPFNFSPKGYALCEGQLLPISQYTAVFSLLGTNYGGDGMSNFALPDFRSADFPGYHVGLENSPLHYHIALQGIFPPRT